MSQNQNGNKVLSDNDQSIKIMEAALDRVHSYFTVLYTVKQNNIGKNHQLSLSTKPTF